jgi:hypothetical protein
MERMLVHTLKLQPTIQNIIIISQSISTTAGNIGIAASVGGRY